MSAKREKLLRDLRVVEESWKEHYETCDDPDFCGHENASLDDVNALQEQIEELMKPLAWKHTDPTEEARFVYEEEDLEEIKGQDPGLLVYPGDTNWPKG